MIKKELDGKVFYCFDSSEIQAREEFEKSMIGEDSVRKMMLALIEACSLVQVKKQKAWEFVKHQLANDNPELKVTEMELEYNWILGGFSVLPTKD